MEHFQQRKDLHAENRSRPRKGAASEDLGRTHFIVGGDRKALNSPSKPSAASSSESDDDLDAFSSKSKHISSSPQARKAKALCGEKNIPATKLLKKSRQKSKKIVSTDVEKEGGSRRLRARKVSSKANGPISPSSAGREKRIKTSSVKQKRTENPLPFPMETELPREGDKSCNKPFPKPAPFIIDVPSSKLSSEARSLAPFPMDLVSSSNCEQWGTDSKPNAPRPFPMDDSFQLSLSKCSNDDDELKIKDNDMILTYGGPRPFPIPLSQITNDSEPTSERRTLDEGSGEVDPRCHRSPGDRDFREYSLRDADVDPSTICPYCDEPWPLTPSPTLLALLERTKSKSYADTRPGNALGLKAPLAVFVELCQRHRLEMTHLPLALARGWPTHIDFAGLPERIDAFKKKLKKLLERPEKSQFWIDVRDDAKQVGSSKAVSVTGQYATFERTQPGYYGEQGSIIIHQSLYSLFPSEIISPASVSPLTPDQFMTRVLVPETAALLIKQDMRLSTKEEAMTVLNESKDYGATMFPEQMQDKDVEAVGEQLAKNRAKAKRKLLELRGETDADIRRALEEEGEKRQTRKVRATKKGLNAPGNVGAKRSADDDRVKDLDSEEALGSKKKSHYHVGLEEAESKVAEDPRKSSMAEWRSKRSPSTSPVKTFEMEDRASSSHEDMHNSTTSNFNSSQSDGNERLTRGLKSAAAMKSAASSDHGRTHGGKATSDNDGGFGTASDKAEQTQKVKRQKGAGRKECLNDASKSLGHTKRRKNRVADNGKLNSDSWLLSDPSD